MLLRSASAVRRLVALVLVGALAVLVAGCGTVPEIPGLKPANVRLGPVLNLLQGGSAKDKVRVVADPAERMHVFIASTPLQQVLDIVVGPDGVAARYVVRSHVSPTTIDAAVDANGRLHVLIDAQHFVLRDGQWRSVEDTVWHGAGVEAERPGFVRGAPDLVWTFVALGRSMGATSGRWVWRGGGGGYPAGGFLLFPWHEQTRKAVMAANGDGREKPWYVLDPGSEADTAILGAACDAAGTIHMVYAAGNNVDLAGTTSFLQGVLTRAPGEISLGYARVRIKDLRSDPPSISDRNQQVREIRPLRDHLAGSRRLDWPYTHTRLPLAVDRLAGTVLLADRWLIRDDTWTSVNATSPFAVGSSPEQVASAGNEAFHAVAIGNIDRRFLGREGIEYSMLSNGSWSEPVWLSIAGTLAVSAATLVEMASNRRGDAFVTWTTADGLVGRWIERSE